VTRVLHEAKYTEGFETFVWRDGSYVPLAEKPMER
jgi:hypothetical protein